MAEMEAYRSLVTWGAVSEEALREADIGARARGISLERAIITELGVPKRTIVKALAIHYGVPYVEYDERIPVPPKLIAHLEADRLSSDNWFPFSEEGGSAVAVAAADPLDEAMRQEVRESFPDASEIRFHVALEEDIQWYILDFMHARPGKLVGTERTGLAYWRNTMAHWRTRMACYRTDLALARTWLAAMRGGLGLVVITDALIRAGKFSSRGPLLALLGLGALMALYGIWQYLKIRKTSLTPPGDQTLVEVTTATVHFLENYDRLEHAYRPPLKGTMLHRLVDFIEPYCMILYPHPGSVERTHLARERNVLAAQRTIAGCYRTLYARARTGLSFIRSGVAFSAAGLSLLHYFKVSAFSAVEASLFVIGVFMIIDGILWYLPARGEQSELTRCPIPE